MFQFPLLSETIQAKMPPTLFSDAVSLKYVTVWNFWPQFPVSRTNVFEVVFNWLDYLGHFCKNIGYAYRSPSGKKLCLRVWTNEKMWISKHPSWAYLLLSPDSFSPQVVIIIHSGSFLNDMKRQRNQWMLASRFVAQTCTLIKVSCHLFTL